MNGTLTLFSSALLLAAGGVVAMQNVRLGSTYSEKSTFLQRQARLGQQMFVTNWQPDIGALFNSTNCVNCHGVPTVGGTRRRPMDRVFMKPDPSVPAGFSNARKRLSDAKDSFIPQDIPEDAVVRKSPALYGAGLLDAVPSSALASLADPTDSNKDGISGRSLLINGKRGRFGWKGSTVTLADFVKEAFHIEVGLKGFSKENPKGMLDDNQLRATTIYLRLLAAPEPTPQISKFSRGKELMEQLDCTKCHVPTLKTGKVSDLPTLSERTFHPYTDLLLHNMKDGELHLVTAGAQAGEVRTPPLWGVTQVGPPYLHDESAYTLEEAILAHGGEGKASAQKFQALSKADQDQIIGFLSNL